MNIASWDWQKLIKIGQTLGFAVLRIIAIAYVTFLIVLYFNQSRLVYMPMAEVRGTPQDIGLSYQPIQLSTKDDIKLSAWFIPAQPKGDRSNQAVILFCHGNGGNISHRLSYLPIFHSLNLSTFIFDYRGYGTSQGTPDEVGTYHDAEAAWQYLTETLHIPPQKIIVYGESLGGAIATYLAHQHQVGGLILASTFTSLPDRAAELYPFIPIRWLSKFAYNSLERLPKVTSPVLVIHSIEDEIIPFHHGQALYAVARAPKQFLQITGDHNNGVFDSLEAYRSSLGKFVAHVLN